MYGARKLDRLVCFRPSYPTPLRLTFPITEQTHLEEFLARSAMGSDVFILFIIISMEESVSYSACFLTISLLISFPLHDAQESSRMRKLRIWGMSGEKMDGMVAIRWTSDRIRYRKRSRYFVRRFGFKPDLRRLLSLEIIKISGQSAWSQNICFFSCYGFLAKDSAMETIPSVLSPYTPNHQLTHLNSYFPCILLITFNLVNSSLSFSSRALLML